MTTVQQVNGAVPITNIQPPPEGQMAASVSFTLSPGTTQYQNTFQLSSQAGLMLSQVVTLIIDNSANPYPLNVIHGALNEVTQVPAASVVIVPTFSSRLGGYPVNVTAIESNTPASDLNITLLFLNFSRQPGTFSAVSQSTIIATGQNTLPLVSGLYTLSPTVQGVIIAGNGGANFILDSMDIAVDGFLPTAAGLSTVVVALSATPDAVSFVDIHHMQSVFTATAGGVWQQGGNVNGPSYRTWPQGLLLPRGYALELRLTTIANTSSIVIRVNISGLNTP